MTELRELLASLLDGPDIQERLEKRDARYQLICDGISRDVNALLDLGHDRVEIAEAYSRVVARSLGRLVAEAAEMANDHNEVCGPSVMLGIIYRFNGEVVNSLDHHTDLIRGNAVEGVTQDESGDVEVRMKQAPIPEGAVHMGPGVELLVDVTCATKQMRVFNHIDGTKGMYQGDLPFLVPVGNNKLRVECCPSCADQGFPLTDITGIKLNFFAFKDKRSTKEYHISGLCQKCQDVAFAPPKGEEDAAPQI